MTEEQGELLWWKIMCIMTTITLVIIVFGTRAHAADCTQSDCMGQFSIRKKVELKSEPAVPVDYTKVLVSGGRHERATTTASQAKSNKRVMGNAPQEPIITESYEVDWSNMPVELASRVAERL